MGNSIVANRYAKALSDLEGIDLKKAEEDLVFLSDAFSENMRMREFFISPLVEVEEKKKVIQKCLQGKVSDDVFKFIMLLIEKRRESELTNICHKFLDENDAAFNRVRAKVISSKNLSGDQDLNEEVDQKIRQALTDFIHQYQESFVSERLNEKTDIKFDIKVDESMLGGIKIRIGDQYLDASISSYLQKWKKQVLSGKVETTSCWVGS